MEIWELVRLLLAHASGTHESFAPGKVSRRYFQHMSTSGGGLNQTFEELDEIVENLVVQLNEAELIVDVDISQGRLAILAAKQRTELGERLFTLLSQAGGVRKLEEMDLEVDKASIEAVLTEVGL
ncbi:TPA: hypothetical protein VDV88_002620 [Pseudomonas aeruginosa]|nr:hypothetical protein [Pseudomonas aeruginosa]HEP9571104.1 hypothetical protein [Pseudomonas aeruginosa]